MTMLETLRAWPAFSLEEVTWAGADDVVETETETMSLVALGISDVMVALRVAVKVAVSTTLASMMVWVRVTVAVVIEVSYLSSMSSSPWAMARAGRKMALKSVVAFMLLMVDDGMIDS